MEQKQASSDAQEVGAIEPANAAFTGTVLPEDRVWVLDIRDTEVFFKAELSAFASQQDTKPEDVIPPSPGIDRQKPFFVRLNGADWGSTRILGAASNGNTDGSDHKTWNGEIYGLTPLTKYSCEFVRLSDQQVICTTSLITLPAPSAEQRECLTSKSACSELTIVATTVPAPPQHQSLRPLSPTSTLKQSIAAAEAKREEIRNKLKRLRKDHKNTSAAVRKEIDQLSGKVASSGGQDERQKQRIQQLKLNVKQAEDATLSLKAELEALGDLPEDELQESAAHKRAWIAACDAKAAALAEYDSAKVEAEKELSDLRNEIATSNQKRERLVARRAKLTETHDRLVNDHNADLSAKQRHEQERQRTLQDYMERESKLHFWISDTRANAENYNIKANELFQEIDFANTQLARQHAAISGPTTPEGDLPGTNGPASRPKTGFDFQMFNAPQIQGMPQTNWGGRGRSSSMLSGYSGFTDDLDVPEGGGLDEQGRKRSDGSSISTGSAGDQFSPRPAVFKPMSPIGPPSFDDKGKGRARMSPIGSNR